MARLYANENFPLATVDFNALAERIHAALAEIGDLHRQLVRVYRPG